MINEFLVKYIIYLHNMINLLFILLVGKPMFTPASDEPVKKEYRKLQVDKIPIFEIPEKLDYKVLLHNYFESHKKELTPVKPRKNKTIIPKEVKCPKCGAPHQYLYDNNGGRGQYLCKVCNTVFNPKNYFQKSVILKCPYCGKTLEKIKTRKDFYVHKCKNDECDFYKTNLASMTKKEREDFKNNPHNYKVRYITREFTFDYKPFSSKSPVKSKISLPKIMVSSHTLGLIMSYYVNYHMSSRQTASIMRDIHGIKISHQTVLNYADAVSHVVKPFVDNYNYELSNSFCGDETYIKVNGKWQYIFFFFDSVKKIILSYRVSPNRDTLSAVEALDDVLSKLKDIPKKLNFIVDGNPIYLLAQHFFASEDINFDITQVIGLTNNDDVSKEYRPLKQIIERLNRTFKGSYRTTCGFNSSDGSIAFVTLFAAYFNFLRTHSTLNHKVPVQIPVLQSLQTMPARWCKLVELAQDYCISQATS
ncbi:transposase [Clostridium kluyveri]|uniref:Transposase n=2 Tax=Clostridium kluyveri TaxID=1534 RepID=A0A1L5FDP8_CLOKL|nr:transposase [Clostridium kluyveri]